jgi:hypothetical protein
MRARPSRALPVRPATAAATMGGAGAKQGLIDDGYYVPPGSGFRPPDRPQHPAELPVRLVRLRGGSALATRAVPPNSPVTWWLIG